MRGGEGAASRRWRERGPRAALFCTQRSRAGRSQSQRAWVGREGRSTNGSSRIKKAGPAARD